MQYHCLRGKRWINCTVKAVAPEGIFLSVRGRILPSKDIPARIKWGLSSADGSGDQSADGSGDQWAEGAARGRLTPDKGWDKYVRRWVEKMGSVRAILDKVKETINTAEEVAKLKMRLLEAFPMHSCNHYSPFRSNPGGIENIEGKLHPSPWEND